MMATSATRAKGVSASAATIKNNKHTIQFSFRTPPRIKDQYITAMWAFSTNPRADGCGRRGLQHACAERSHLGFYRNMARTPIPAAAVCYVTYRSAARCLLKRIL